MANGSHLDLDLTGRNIFTRSNIILLHQILSSNVCQTVQHTNQTGRRRPLNSGLPQIAPTLSRGSPPLNCSCSILRRQIHWKSPIALRGYGSASDNPTSGFRITKIEGQDKVISSKIAAILDLRSQKSMVQSFYWHTVWNYFTVLTPKAVKRAAQLAQIVKNVFKQAMAAILNFR